MRDSYGRTIDYLRISVTDRCNLRCRYCMPENGVPFVPHTEILQYEEILRLIPIFQSLGFRKVKLTGGEPLLRSGLASLAAGIRQAGMEQVTLTTNGILLREKLPELLEAGVDAVNISIDTLDRAAFADLTRRDALDQVLDGLHAALEVPGLKIKLNCVPILTDQENVIRLAALAKNHPLHVRFIEMMPIGAGSACHGLSEAEMKALLSARFGPLEPIRDSLGNGPAHYYAVPGFQGRIGFISAVSHQFCDGCNRIRLTAEGYLKTCLQYHVGVDLKAILRSGGSDETLRLAIADAIAKKPMAHHFLEKPQENDERGWMSGIGG
jgi:cyclic pyranopterin phosphate synthase